MNYSAIAIRYSKALFSLSKEKNLLPKVYKDMQLIKSICDENIAFKNFLDNPVLQFSQKRKIFTGIFENRINPISLNFLYLIAKNRRENHLKQMTNDFMKFYKEDKNIKTVFITTVSPINDKVRKIIKTSVKEKFNSDTELIENTNPDIIGGFILRLDDEQYNASVVYQLEKIKKDFIEI